jgi:hypothetical protein
MRKLSRTPVALTAVGSALVLGASVLTTSSAIASSPPSSERVLATSNGPVFQIARRKGVVYFADSSGSIKKITKRGPRLVMAWPEITAVEFSRNGKVMAVASGNPAPGGTPQRVTLVRGKKRVIAEVGRYEQSANPDGNVTYGITTGASAACKAQVETPQPDGPPGPPVPVTYKGAVDSNPYQLAALRGGAFALADAGGNTILRIGARGRISTIAVLPRQRITLTTAQATALRAPDCAGETYATEPVPTDVERGPNGSLLVTTLPGGPESPALGARGSVYRISKHGAVSRVATGFLGATNLAVYKGRVYVTEFFSGNITKFGRGGRFVRANVPGAVSIEASRGKLYIGTANFGGASQVHRIPR